MANVLTSLDQARFQAKLLHFQLLNLLDSEYSNYIESILEQKAIIQSKLEHDYQQQMQMIDEQSRILMRVMSQHKNVCDDKEILSYPMMVTNNMGSHTTITSPIQFHQHLIDRVTPAKNDTIHHRQLHNYNNENQLNCTSMNLNLNKSMNIGSLYSGHDEDDVFCNINSIPKLEYDDSNVSNSININGQDCTFTSNWTSASSMGAMIITDTTSAGASLQDDRNGKIITNVSTNVISSGINKMNGLNIDKDKKVSKITTCINDNHDDNNSSANITSAHQFHDPSLSSSYTHNTHLSKIRLPKLKMMDNMTTDNHQHTETSKNNCNSNNNNNNNNKQIQSGRRRRTSKSKYYKRYIVDGVTKFECHECKHIFLKVAQARSHYLIQHSTKYQCNFNNCNKRFPTINKLQRHERSHTKIRPFPCPICQKPFRSKSNLNVHLKMHRKKPYQCEYCRKRFDKQETMKKHQIIHLTGRPHQCKICGVAFRKPHHLTRHFKTHTGEQPYQCRFCDKKFSLKSNCKRHEKQVHGFEESNSAES